MDVKNKQFQLNDVKDSPRSGRPKTKSVSEDRNLLIVVKLASFTGKMEYQ